MESILDRILEGVRSDEDRQGAASAGSELVLVGRPRPADVVPLLEREFLLIAELKRRSPSAGTIRRRFDPARLARACERGGASAISVLTEQRFFGGSGADLAAVKRSVAVPVLRKDFIVRLRQVRESYNLGADFVLLIAACLEWRALAELYLATRELGMRAIVEVHSEKDLDRALRVRPRIIGINNRDLSTLRVDIETSFRLKRLIPDGHFVIAESGIRTAAQINRLRREGFAGALVGESLMRRRDVAGAVRRLVNG